jgi:hypothetical protein
VTLIDRYIADVARRLPRAKRADISRELRSTLLDAVESRFGSAASDEHEAAVLKEFGPPQVVAASYAPSTQYLIGPEWYPTFSAVLRINLIAIIGLSILGFAFAVFVPGILGDPGQAMASFAGGLFHTALLVFGTVVLVFHLLERAEVRSPQRVRDWDPHELPAVTESSTVGRSESLTSIAFAAVWLVLLYGFRDAIGFRFGGTLLLNDVFLANLPWIAAGSLGTMALYALLLWQGHWAWYTRAAKLSLDVFGVYIAYRVSQGIIEAQGTLLVAGMPAGLVTILMQFAAVAPYVAGIAMAIDAGTMILHASRRSASQLVPAACILAAVLCAAPANPARSSDTVEADGVTIAYETFGPDGGEPVLLIAGFGAQMTMWPDELCQELARRGQRAIRFDHRDVGLSSRLNHLGRPDWAAIQAAAEAGTPVPLPYSLADMASCSTP